MNAFSDVKFRLDIDHGIHLLLNWRIKERRKRGELSFKTKHFRCTCVVLAYRIEMNRNRTISFFVQTNGRANTEFAKGSVLRVLSINFLLNLFWLVLLSLFGSVFVVVLYFLAADIEIIANVSNLSLRVYRSLLLD